MRMEIALVFLLGCGTTAPSTAPKSRVPVEGASIRSKPPTAEPNRTVEKCVFDPNIPVASAPIPGVKTKPPIVSGPYWVPDPCYSMHQTRFSCERALVESPDDQAWLWICASVACSFGDGDGAVDYIGRIESREKKVGLRALCKMYGIAVAPE